ncbi:MAG: hypothetical protein JO290_05125 [Sphingomonadaceae bacterium]|nr:hypothetical protein [Sphingomonadaceae bacterium]
MDHGTLALLIPIAAMTIPIVAILSRPLGRWIALQEKKHEAQVRFADAQAAEHAAKIERLEAHVAVLNRIATDRATGLAHEIESLRGPSAPLN